MKKWIKMILLLAVVVCLPGCKSAQEQPTAGGWQTQYDLGMRYLSEGNYQEAILAFTAAIEIDPKQAPAYVRRGDAYVLSGETETNLVAAKVDYERAIELDETNAEAYLGLADVYIRQGDYEKALEILEEGQKKAKNVHSIIDKITEINSNIGFNSYGATEFILRSNFYSFSDMSAEEQYVVDAIGNAIICNDTMALYDLLNVSKIDAFYNNSIYTMWNGYKMSLMFRPYEVGNEGDQTGSIEAALRPKNGVGYAGSIYSTSAITTFARDHWWDYYYSEHFYSMPMC